jgi:hypothetical protein
VCTKVAHLKEGEVRLRRDSSLCNRAGDLDLVSAGPRTRCILSLSGLEMLLELYDQTGQTRKLTSKLECR